MADPEIPQKRETTLYVGRQPILNSEQKLIAYELLFRGASGQRGRVIDDVQATSQVLVNTLSHFGAEQVLGDKRAFINVSQDMLMSDLLDSLPRERLVLELLESVAPTAEVVARAQQLVKAGFQIALDDFVYRPEYDPLIAVASFVKLDLRALGVQGVTQHVQKLRGRGIRLLAEKVETRAEFEQCRSLLINCYQGYYFAKPDVLKMRAVDPSTQRLLHIFNLMATGAEPAEIETAFRQDVALSYKLLRYINSVGMGLRHKVESIKHALVIIGHKQLSRWLSLLLLSGSAQTLAPDALYRTALVRARFMELAAAGNRQAAPDLVFMTGMFSLLDAMLDRPLADVLSQLTLPEPVQQALLEGKGVIAPYLALALAVEAADLESIAASAAALHLNPAAINEAQSTALRWSEEVAGIA